MRTLRVLLFVEAVAFAGAALIHFGVLLAGYEHQKASIAETAISAVLLLAWAIAGVRPQWTRRAGVVAQGFALLGTLLGLSMIFIGPGPQTLPDLVYHIAIAAVLAAGLVMAGRARENMLPV
jgi:hypothetical protein